MTQVPVLQQKEYRLQRVFPSDSWASFLFVPSLGQGPRLFTW